MKKILYQRGTDMRTTTNINIQTNLSNKYTYVEGHTKFAFLIRGPCYQHWLT